MGKTSDSAPRLPAVVHRRRLLKRLEDVVAPGIVVVSAQATQGKSTLIADYLETTGARVCWVHMRPEDTDPEHFRCHLRDACRPHRLPPQANPAVERSLPGAAGRSVSEMIADLFNNLPTDLHLVFDGWHHLGSSPLSAEWIDALLTARPADGCVYLISRANLSINLQRDRMQRRALLLTGDELAFTRDEIGDFFQTLSGVTLDAARCRQIHDLTAGWAGGLVLLAEELHRQPGDPNKIIDDPALPGRIQAEAGHYFEEEIYGNQSDAMQVFLVVAALLDTVCAALIREHMGRHEADRLFTEAARQNLFMQILNADANHWRFQFTPLLRAFLLSKGQTTLSKDTIDGFLHKAAHHYEAAGDIASAVNYFLKAGDMTATIAGITKLGQQLSIAGRFSEINRWTAMLPATVLQDDPWLALLKAVTFRIKGGQRTIRELEDLQAKFCQAGLLRGKMLCLAYLIETAVFVGFDPAARAQWIAEGEALLEKTSRLPHFTYAKALLWQQIGFGAIADNAGDLQKGLSACQNAVILGKRIDAPRLVVNALTIAAHGHVQAGDFEQARESLQATDDLDDRTAFPEYGALRDLTRIHLELIGGRMAPAADLLKRVEGDIDTFGLVILYPAFLEATGLLHIYGKQYAALERTCRHMHDVGTLLNNPVYGARAFWLAGLSGYHQGRYRSALAIIRRAMEIPDLPAMDRARNRELLGFITLNAGQFDTAEKHFRQALGYFEHAGLALVACETRIGLALAQNARQDAEAAQHSLDAAFQTASARQYQHLPVIRPADLARACVLSIKLEIPSAVVHAHHLLATRLVDVETQFLESTRNADAFTRSIDAGETRNAIYRARIPVLDIRTLGGLQILRNGSDPIRAGAWQGSRPALLLKAILVHGGRHIPKDILIEALWPDQHPENSHGNFKVTLHRLRKLLEPDMNSAIGSVYIHLKDNLVSLDTDLCQVDTVAFHRLCKQARRIDPGVDALTVLEMSREAETLYQGDFLPEEPYLAWAEMKRSTLREEYLQLMYRLGQLLFDQHEYSEARRCYRLIVRIDPAQEKAQRRLMRLLADAGRPQEAVRVYREFRTHLASDIGAAPDEATTTLFQSICHRLNRKTDLPE